MDPKRKEPSQPPTCPNSSSASVAASEDDLHRVTNELGPDELHHLFHNLGISQRDIEHAERSANTNDTRLKARAVLRWWKQTIGRDATWEAVLDAQKKICSSSTAAISSTEFDLPNFKKTLTDLYDEELGRMLLLPWNNECNEMRYLDDIYVELILQDGNKTLNMNEELVDLKTCKDKLAKRIIVKGIPGSGKSVLLSKLAYQWSKQDPFSPLNKFELVFLLHIRDLHTGQDLVDAICNQVTGYVPSGLKDFICNNQDKILVLADGMDEGNLKVQTSKIKSQTMKIEQMLANESLPKCHVIVSTRPHTHLGPIESMFYSEVVIKGFSSEKIRTYVERYFHGKEGSDKLIEGLLEKLKLSDMLATASKIPMILMLLCILWEDQITFPDTLTMLYDEFVEAIWKRFCQKSNTETKLSCAEIQLQIGKIALQGILPRNNVTEDILEFPAEQFGAVLDLGIKVGLITRQRWKFRLQEKTSVSFLHKSIQEFCAGKYLAEMFHKDRNQFDNLLNQLHTLDLIRQKFELLRFCCGAAHHMSERSNAISRFCCGAAHHMSERSNAIAIINHVTRTYSMCVDRSHCLSHINIGSLSDDHLLLVLELLNEGKILKAESNRLSLFHILSGVDTVSINSYPPDLQALTVFQCSIQTEIGKQAFGSIPSIEFNNVDSDSINRISETLQHTPWLKTLTLKGNFRDTSVEIVKRLGKAILNLPRLSKLRMFFPDNYPDMYNWDIMNIFLAEMSGAVCRSSNVMPVRPLKDLTLVNVPVGDAINYMGDIITQYLECLTMKKAALEEQHIETLSAFRPDALNLSELDLSWNNIGVAGVSLANSLRNCHQLKILNLSQAHLTNASITTLAESFPHICRLENLNLSSNDIGNNIVSLANHLQHCHRLQVLNLSKTSLTDEGITALAASFGHWSSLKQIHLGANDVGNSGLDAIFKHIHHLPKLIWFNVHPDIDSQCSTLVKDCLYALGESVPDRRIKMSIFATDGKIRSVQRVQTLQRIVRAPLVPFQNRTDVCAQK